MQSLTRGEIRRSIERNLGIAIIGSATSTTDTTSLIDVTNLRGADDDHIDAQVIIYDAAGSIVDGETKLVTDYDSTNKDATTGAFTAAITSGDKYEMIENPWFKDDIDQAINDAISEVTNRCLKIKEIHTPFTEDEKYLYDCLSSYKYLQRVEYAYDIGTEKTIHKCGSTWDDDTDVTSSVDSNFYKEGSSSTKFVVGAGASANDILATDVITEVDLSGCTQVQIWVYSTVALSAGDLQLLLDDTATCASPVETLNIPATTANVWTRHIISLANPQSDSAIISVGIKMVTDKGAFNLWADDIKAIDEYSNRYYTLPKDKWNIVRASTPLLQITNAGLSVTGTNTQLRLTGWQIPSLLTADTTTSDVDPGWLILKVSGELALNHSKSPSLDMGNREDYGITKLKQAQAMLPAITTSIGDARKVS